MKRFTLIIVFGYFLQQSASSQDLLITNIHGNKITDRYQDFDLDLEVKNNGIIDTPEDIDVYYYGWLSEDSVLDESDEQICNYYNEPIAAHTSITVPGWLTPRRSLPGTYFLIMRIDPDNMIEETDENNNDFILPGVVVENAELDFYYGTISFSPTVPVHAPITGVFEVIHEGPTHITTEHVSTNFYLSVDEFFNEDEDTRIGWTMTYMYHGPDTYTTSLETFYPVIPAGTPTGQYYIIMRLDDDDPTYNFDETDESNNETVVPITVIDSDIDLSIINVDAAVTFVPNWDYPRIDTKLTIANSGTTTMATFYNIKMILSVDSLLDESDFAVNMTGPFGSTIFSQDTIEMEADGHPFDVPEGEYFVFVVINPDQLIEEDHYTDNVRMYPHKISLIFPTQDYKLMNAAPHKLEISKSEPLTLQLYFENKSPNGYLNDVFHFLVLDSEWHVLDLSSQSVSFNFPDTGAYYKNVSFNIHQTVPPGYYRLQVHTSDTILTTHFSLKENPYNLAGNIASESGPALERGKLFLYKKTGDHLEIHQADHDISLSFFNFNLRHGIFTLYYVPPAHDTLHVPTVFGKTIKLQNTSYITMDSNTWVTMEVIKLQPLAIGPLSITGKLDYTNSIGRLSTGETTQGIPNYTMILLNAEGAPVKKTTTDNDGNYAFNNLPAGEYQVTIAFEPISVWQITEPATVVLVDQDIHADFYFNISGPNELTIETITRISQTLTLGVFENIQYDDGPINLTLKTNAGLPVTYTSASPNIASIENGQIIIHDIGSTLIQATQEGNDVYGAFEKTFVLSVIKADQTIQFDALEEVTHLKDIDLPLRATSGLPITYSSSNTAVATLAGNTLKIHDVGTTIITAMQEGNNYYEPAENVARTLVVLSITDTEEDLTPITIHPNPVREAISVKTNTNIHRTSITDIVGRTSSLLIKNNMIDVSHLATGIYVLRLYTAKNVSTFKIIKE